MPPEPQRPTPATPPPAKPKTDEEPPKLEDDKRIERFPER